MSRSYKKNVVYKDGGKKDKQLANRKIRRVNKIRVTQEDTPLQSKELVNPYDVCDYKCWVYEENEDYEKIKRK